MNLWPFLHTLIAFLAAPLLLGVINRTKAFFAGRTGQPLLQPYHEIRKLISKSSVYSRTTTRIFKLGPIVILSASAVALAAVPWAGLNAPLAFSGDLVLLAYMLGLARFFIVCAALDTGSAFEGMGASREVFFSALAEPVLLVGLAALTRLAGSFSLSAVYAQVTPGLWIQHGPALLLVLAALFVVFLTENARIPVDDPTTHLELTMIHEVMVLDHSGPDFAMILYGSALKLWILGALIAGLLPIHTGIVPLDVVLFAAAMLALAVTVGVVESTMARLRLVHVPQMLVGAGALAILAIFLVLR